MLSDERLQATYFIAYKDAPESEDEHVAGLRAIATAAAQAERHRIYAALEADPGALWRDQGFQEWRRNRVQD